MRPSWLAAPAALFLTSCVSVNVNHHVAATDYNRTLTRILVVMPSDDNFGAAFSKDFTPSFRSGIEAQLASCHVATLVYQVDSMQLDGVAKLRAAGASFMPDGLLVVQHTNRFLINGEERGEGYLLTLSDPSQHRDIWKGSIGIGSSSAFLADRSQTGATFAAKAVRQMADDGVLKTCPPPARAS